MLDISNKFDTFYAVLYDRPIGLFLYDVLAFVVPVNKYRCYVVLCIFIRKIISSNAQATTMKLIQRT